MMGDTEEIKKRMDEADRAEKKQSTDALRDKFAIAALQGLLLRQVPDGYDISVKFDRLAENSFELAEAMLRARPS